MKSFNKFFSSIKALLVLVSGLLVLSTMSFAGEMPNTANKLIKYKGASVQVLQGSADGLWNETNIDGYDVWYYGQTSTNPLTGETTYSYDTGSANSGTLYMDFDISTMTSPYLTLETKYAAESNLSFDLMQIMVGSDILWEKSSNESTDASGSWGWESLELDLSSYYGSTNVQVSFYFDTKDSIGNNHFGWALYNVQAVDYATGTPGGGGSVGGGPKLVINQLDIGNFPSIDAYVTVTDASGQSVSGLTESDFSVLEDNSIVSNFTVTPLASSGDPQPLALGLMIDQSGSMSYNMSDAVTAVKDFINLSTGVQDQFGLVSIGSYDSAADNQVLVLEDFTTDKTALLDAVDSLTASGMTPLYDGIAKMLELTAQQAGIKAVIAFTDGDDTYSKSYDEDTVITLAKEKGIPVYTIGIGYADEAILTKIALQTGGTYTEASTVSDLSSIYSQLLNVINQQYYINYTALDPTIGNDPGTGGFNILGSGDPSSSYASQTCVTIAAQIPDYVSDTSCYDKQNSPPKVALDATTSDYLSSGATYGSDLVIGAVVTDADGDTITDVSLFYRAYGSTDSFTKMDMDQDTSYVPSYSSSGTDVYFAATIDGMYYADPGLEFYITASDGTFTKTSPTNDYYTVTGSGDPGTGTGGSAQEIYILSPSNNEAISFGSTGGVVTFSWTKLSNVEKYVLNLQLTDILSGVVIPIPIDLYWCAGGSSSGGITNPWGGSTGGTSSCTQDTNLVESFLGMTYSLALDAATWDVLALYDMKWGIEAYDDSNNLIGSTFESGVAASAVNNLKFLASTAIAMTSPSLGEVLDQSSSAAPTFKWDAYTGVSTYTMILAHVGSLGFDNVMPLDAGALTLYPMDTATWQSMPTGTWYWTVFGYDASGNQTPAGFNLFDFTVQ